jgi:hypothetical protein
MCGRKGDKLIAVLVKCNVEFCVFYSVFLRRNLRRMRWVGVGHVTCMAVMRNLFHNLV